jgi:hypothetical protein
MGRGGVLRGGLLTSRLPVETLALARFAQKGATVPLPRGRVAKIHFDAKQHPFKRFGLQPHWQVSRYTPGVKGSALPQWRLPVFRSF